MSATDINSNKKDLTMFRNIPRSIINKGFFNYVYAGSGDFTRPTSVVYNKVQARNASQNLPRLPVPKLEDTVKKFLLSAKPFLNDSEYKKTEKIFKDFTSADGCGPILQKKLLERAHNTENWLADWWLNVAYLEFRSPVVVFSSPGLVFPFQEFNSKKDQLVYAAKIIAAAVDYKIAVDCDKIPLDMMGKDPLDMNQYKRIFGTCRIPAIPRDCLEFNPDSKHIVVIHNNHFFKVDVFNHQKEPLNVEQLTEQLEFVVQNSRYPTQPIGILTSDNRDNWGNAYKMLIQDSQNEESLNTIQKSLFTMSIDDPMPPMKGANRRTIASAQLIHGGGSVANAGNRWYDKTVQFVVGVDGINGLTYEHSPSEGQPIAVMTDHLINFIKNDKGKNVPYADYNCDPVELKFKVCDDELKCALKTAAKNIDQLAEDLAIDSVQFECFGKDFIKKQKLSPDSFIQVAMQYAFYRLHNEPGAHYESAATRKYIHGRTETIRSCSIESVAFAKAMLDCRVTDEDKIKALKAAVASHKKYTLDAVNGFGVDRHLLGLKLTAIENNLSIPEIYDDKAYTKSNYMRISSSQVATKCDGFMVYGPLVKDGYACCYNPRDNDINMGITAHASCDSTKVSAFRESMEESLKDMHELLAKNQPAKM